MVKWISWFVDWYHTILNEGTYLVMLVYCRYHEDITTCIIIIIAESVCTGWQFFAFILDVAINMVIFPQLGIIHHLFTVNIYVVIFFVAWLILHIRQCKEYIIGVLLIIFIAVIIISHILHLQSRNWREHFTIVKWSIVT